LFELENGASWSLGQEAESSDPFSSTLIRRPTNNIELA
jgi:hypothetical protein